MTITNRTVHHECAPQEAASQIQWEELGTGSVVTCDECGQHWGVMRDSKGVEFAPITRRHRFVLVLFAGTPMYRWIMHRWGLYIDRGGYLA